MQPNQPGVLHVDVLLDELVDVVVGWLVDSSKQPHQPGDLQVSVRVCVNDVDDWMLVDVPLELLLSKYFH